MSGRHLPNDTRPVSRARKVLTLNVRPLQGRCEPPWPRKWSGKISGTEPNGGGKTMNESRTCCNQLLRGHRWLEVKRQHITRLVTLLSRMPLATSRTLSRLSQQLIFMGTLSIQIRYTEFNWTLTGQMGRDFAQKKPL